MTDKKMTIGDLRAVGFCVSGIRDRYEEMGLDLPFATFVREGMDLDLARSLGDAQVMRAVEHAEKRIAGGSDGRR